MLFSVQILFFIVKNKKSILQIKQNQNKTVLYQSKYILNQLLLINITNAKANNNKKHIANHHLEITSALIKSSARMGKVRKQPKRSTKKLNQPFMRNIFLNQNQQSQNSNLPKNLLNSLSKVTEIPINTLEQLIPEPLEHELDLNLQLMKSALDAQQQRIKYVQVKYASSNGSNGQKREKGYYQQSQAHINCHAASHIKSSINSRSHLYSHLHLLNSPFNHRQQLRDQIIRQQTKKTMNTINSSYREQLHLLNEEDNLFYNFNNQSQQQLQLQLQKRNDIDGGEEGQFMELDQNHQNQLNQLNQQKNDNIMVCDELDFLCL